MAEFSDILSQVIGGVRDIALSPGGFGGAFGGESPTGTFGGFRGVSQPLFIQQVAQMPTAQQALFGIGEGNGCPPPRPRMPSAVVTPNPCNPQNPTVYLKAGSVSSAVFPSLVRSQNKKARKVATAAGVRRSAARKRR